MSFDLTKFEKDLAASIEKAKAAAAAQKDDGGSSNFDAATVAVPHASHEKAMDVAKKLGIHAHALSGPLWKGSLYLSPPVGAQGFRRTKQAEAMSETLKAAGWKAMTYYQVD